jgi:hypothetical protein
VLVLCIYAQSNCSEGCTPDYHECALMAARRTTTCASATDLYTLYPARQGRSNHKSSDGCTPDYRVCARGQHSGQSRVLVLRRNESSADRTLSAGAKYVQNISSETAPAVLVLTAKRLTNSQCGTTWIRSHDLARRRVNRFSPGDLNLDAVPAGHWI